ncbi:DgyrCDS11941 [Dimorphilus gyrociliatus]|uniref:DgyrCDS11941 n=1 Tax=Dimorphilus gyrociliatus TaxID=2664684 RepID=A0A7I8W5V8_9ANNE|nr:DgyrCDS11941 [Dimorphilus gyrociliatus]
MPESFIFKYILSISAATVAETVTYPLDITKTRLQIQGEVASAVPYRGVTKTLCGIVSEEGPFKLWQGVTPAIYRHIVYTGCRMGFYEYARDKIFGKNHDGTFPLWKAVLCGMSSGALAQFIASPTDLVKVQMQMEGKRKLDGLPQRVKNVPDAFRNILTESGIKGLWKGWLPNVQRAALVNLGDLTTYDTAKHHILKHTSLGDNHLTHALSSVCSGFIAATLGTPADVVKTRMMNQSTSKLYSSSIHCFISTARNEGFKAFYKGFIPTWARMAPWSLTFWLTYEEIRHLSGVLSF